MKQIIIPLLFSVSSFAAEFDCSYFYNLNEIYRNDVSISEGSKNLKIGELEEYEFFMSSLGSGKFELQALNVYEPSRSYATAILGQENRELALVIWKRESMVEVACTLKAN